VELLRPAFGQCLLSNTPTLAAQLVHYLGLELDKEILEPWDTSSGALVKVVREPEEQSSDLAVEQKLLRYHQACLAASCTSGLQHVSVATDKSRVWGLGS